MKNKKLLIASALFAGISTTASYSAVTYVDATTSNSKLDGEDFVLGTYSGGVFNPTDANYSSNSAGSGDTGNWKLRTSLATNGGDAWTAAQNGGIARDDYGLIETTHTFTEAGQYDIYGYFWIGGNGSGAWDAGFQLGENGTMVTYTKDNATDLESLAGVDNHFSSTVAYDTNDYDMFEAYLGTWDTAVDGDTVTVYVSANVRADLANDNRTRYDGIGYSAVPETSAYALLGGLCALTFVALRRRKA